MNWIVTDNIHRVKEKPARKKIASANTFTVDTINDTIYYVTGDKSLYTSPSSQIDVGKVQITGLIFDGHDTIYFTSSNCVMKLNVNSKIISIFQKDIGGASSNTSSHPLGITMDKNGDLYVMLQNAIYKIFMKTGIIEKKASFTMETFVKGYYRSEGIVVSDETICVTNSFGNCIRKFAGDQMSEISLPSSPHSLTIDADGNLIAVCSPHQIFRINLQTNAVSMVPTPIGVRNVNCVFRDLKGHLWFGGNSIIQIFYVWTWERLLWIAKKKEDASYCILATLPTELIREIAKHLKDPKPAPPPPPQIIDPNFW